MRTLILVLVLVLLFPVIASADWYVVKPSGKVMAKTEYEPSQADLDTRKEIKVFSEEDIELSQAEYKNDKIMKHKKTPQEISAEVKREERATEERFIQEEMRKETIKKLKERGHQFRHIE